MKKYSYARITLALDIIRKIEKGQYAGFHEMQILKHMIDLHDTIKIKESDEMEIKCNHPDVPTDEHNICWKAAKLIKEGFNIDKNVSITIKKRIPVRAGLAGGSSNAATTLEILNEMWDLKLTTEELMNLGRKIGMDIPYFFIGGTAFDNEIGTIEKIETDVKLDLAISTPPIGVSTKKAFEAIDLSKCSKNKEKTKDLILGFVNGSITDIQKNIHNDFETVIYDIYPEIKQKKDALTAPAVLSGSGSSIVCVSKDKIKNAIVAESK